MSKFQLEGRRHIGIVTGGDKDSPDPVQAGRVQVGLPHYMSPDNDVTNLPWSQIALDGNQSGGFTRPPQVGSLVSIYYPVGSRNSMRGIVEHVYDGINTFQDISDNKSLLKSGWIAKAIKKAPPGMVGFAKTSDKSDTNPTGKEKITIGSDSAGKVPSMLERKDLLTSFATKPFVQLYNKVTNVAKATEEALNITPFGTNFPGNLFNLSSISSAIPELKGMISAMGQNNPLSGSNFLSIGSRVSTSGLNKLIQQAKDDLKTGQYKLEEVMQRLLDNLDTVGSTGLQEVETEIESVFGKMKQVLGTDGKITNTASDAINEAISAFSSFVESVPSVLGSILKNSEIPTTHLKRLPSEGQTRLKQAIENMATVKGSAQEAMDFLNG